MILVDDPHVHFIRTNNYQGECVVGSIPHEKENSISSQKAQNVMHRILYGL